METWKECLLGDVADWGAGGTPSRGNKEYYIGKIPWIKSGELKNKYLLDTEEKISQKAIENSSAKVFPKGSVAIAMYGATIGKTSILGIDASSNQAVAVAKPHPDKIISEFLYYYLLSKERDFINLGQGGAQPNISQAVLKSFEFKYPSIKLQKLIINKIESLFAEIDAGVEELKKIKEKLELYKQSVLNAAIRGKLVPQDPKDEPASKLLERIRAEKEKLIKEGKIKKEKPLPPIDPSEIPFELPKGWEWVRLQDLISALGDGLHGTPTYTLNSNYYFINGNNLDNGRIVIKPGTKSVSFEEYNKYKKNLTDRTILVSINGTLGNVAFFNNEKIILGKSACYFNLIKGLEMSYIKLIIESPYYFQYAFEKATGSTIKNVSLASMRNLPVPLCSLSSQLKICNSVDTAIKANISDVHYIETQLMKANLLKQSILKQAFEGKLI